MDGEFYASNIRICVIDMPSKTPKQHRFIEAAGVEETSDSALEIIRVENPDEAIPKITALERAAGKLPQVDCPLRHWFPTGLYAREIFMPAGTVITSKVHKFEHLTVVMEGIATVFDEGGQTKVVCAPDVFVTQPGTKRALWIHEDSVWMTVHATDVKTVEEAEETLVADASTPDEYRRILEQIQVKQIEATS
jgi:hypothetical protein